MTTDELASEPLGALEIANLQLEAASTLMPFIDTMLNELDERLTILSDVVDCWLHLPPYVRTAYSGMQHIGALERFVGDYVDDIEHIWTDGQFRHWCEMTDDEAEQCKRRTWRQRVADVRRRRVAGEQPSDEWLQRVTWNQMRQ